VPWRGQSGTRLSGLLSCPTPAVADRGRGLTAKIIEGGGFLAVKKLMLVVLLLGLGGFAVWRKVQSDRAELDLWTEATTADEN
jgi:hypothetical protein